MCESRLRPRAQAEEGPVRPDPGCSAGHCADLGKRARLKSRGQRKRQVGGGPKQRGRADTRRDERRRVERERSAPATGLTTRTRLAGGGGWEGARMGPARSLGPPLARLTLLWASERQGWAATPHRAGRFDLPRAQGETRVRAAEDLRTQLARRVELRRQVCGELLGRERRRRRGGRRDHRDGKALHHARQQRPRGRLLRDGVDGLRSERQTGCAPFQTAPHACRRCGARFSRIRCTQAGSSLWLQHVCTARRRAVGTACVPCGASIQRVEIEQVGERDRSVAADPDGQRERVHVGEDGQRDEFLLRARAHAHSVGQQPMPGE